MEGFCPISLSHQKVNVFSNRAYYIEHLFDFLPDNQVGGDQNHNRLSAKKVQKNDRYYMRGFKKN